MAAQMVRISAEVAAAVLNSASDEAAAVVGTVLVVASGATV